MPACRRSVLRKIVVLIFSSSFFLILPFSLILFISSPVLSVPTHLDRSKVSKGCGECHKGHGWRGTPLLKKERDEACFQCHSLNGKASDIRSELSKPFRHPVLETAQYHLPGEELPEKSASQQRHASCRDCHNVHKSEKGRSWQGIRGYSGVSKVKKTDREYETCYNCHADSDKHVKKESNVADDFSPANASFHPVETYGVNRFVPSLRGAMKSSSLINCTDCHGNDNSSGPKGPHGSIYKSLLRYEYVRTPGPESPRTYELCYSCHTRTSILNDESFQSHKMHVVYNQTSCAQCHASHGSRMNAHLIQFDQSAVFANSKGGFGYMTGQQGRPRCLLSCHSRGKNHDHILNEKLQYCVNARCVEGW